jgi:hypothetical protein
MTINIRQYPVRERDGSLLNASRIQQLAACDRAVPRLPRVNTHRVNRRSLASRSVEMAKSGNGGLDLGLAARDRQLATRAILKRGAAR